MEFPVVFSWEKSNCYRVDSALGRCTDGIVRLRFSGCIIAGLGWEGGESMDCAWNASNAHILILNARSLVRKGKKTFTRCLVSLVR